MSKYQKKQATKLTDYFISTEFDCKCSSSNCRETLIDEQLVSYLQQIRKHFGKPIIINSGYRCAAHNNRVGGARESHHKYGRAADIVVSGVEPKEVAKYAESIGIKGIGLYSNFIHIDTRDIKYFWKDSTTNSVSTFGLATTNKDLTTTQQTLFFGKKNNDVKLLQERLISIGYDLGAFGADGHFGTKTYIAVRQFQKDKGLKVDGICGAKTWAALLE